MRGAAGGVVPLELYQSWQFPLDPEVPLVDFGVPVSLAPVVAVRVSPKRQLAVLSLLRAAILPVGGIALAVIQPCRTSQHGFVVQPVGEAEARRHVVEVGVRVTPARGGQNRSPQDLPAREFSQAGHEDSAVTGEATERVVIVALGIRSAPLIAESQVERQAAGHLPVV